MPVTATASARELSTWAPAIGQGRADVGSLAGYDPDRCHRQLLALVDVLPNGCWRWRGARAPSGEPLFWLAPGRAVWATRLAAWLSTGVDPGPSAYAPFALCEAPDCVRPDDVAPLPAPDSIRTTRTHVKRPRVRRTDAYLAVSARRRALTQSDLAFVLANYRLWTAHGALTIQDLAAVLATETTQMAELVSWGRRAVCDLVTSWDPVMVAGLSRSAARHVRTRRRGQKCTAA